MKTKLTLKVATALLSLSVLIPQFSPAQTSGNSPARPSRPGRLQRLERRQEWEHQQRSFPLNDIPPGARQRAIMQIQQAEASSPPGAGFTGYGWFPVGPTPIHDPKGKLTGFDTIGRVSAIAVDPGSQDHWLLGAAQGGIWQTFDIGDNWSPVTDDAPSLAIGAITFAPSNPQIVYAGTGEGSFSFVSYAGMGVLKSLDGGTTWFLVAGAPFAETSFSDIKVHSSNPNSLVAATVRGVMGRVENGTDIPPAAPPRGIFVSNNGGTNWTQTLFGEATDVEVLAGNFDRQYAALGEIFGAPTNGVYRSINGGMGWTRIDGPWTAVGATNLGRIEMALAPSSPGRLYVSVAETRELGLPNFLMDVWVTDNAWDLVPTWTVLPFPTGSGRQLWYSHNLLVHPNNPDVLYAAYFDPMRFDGSEWLTLRNHHPDQHALAWAPTFDPNVKRLLAGHDGGLSSRTDNVGGWASHLGNGSRLAITQFYRGAAHPEDSSVLLGGSQDNGTELYNGDSNFEWTAVNGGDGYSCFIATNPPNKQFWAVSSQNLDISRTQDGQNFIGAGPGINGNIFVGEFIKHPVNHDVCLAAVFNLFRRETFWSDTAPSWTANSPTLLRPDGEFAQISAIAFAPSNTTGRIYAYGTEAGQLRLTTNAGMNWVDIDVGGAVPERFVSSLAFSPANADVLYVVLSGFDEGTPGHPGHVFKTVNALAANPAWANVSPPVNLPQNCIAIDPLDAQDLFLGCDIGVWHSANGGTFWTHQGPAIGMPNVAVFDLQFDQVAHLTAFTHGRGAFTYTELPIFDVPNCIFASCWPLFINPEDLVTIYLPLRNEVPILPVNLTAHLRPTTQILPLNGSQVQSYGPLSPAMGTVTRPFQFQAVPGSGAGGPGESDSAGGCGGFVNVTFDLEDAGAPRGTVAIPLRLGTLMQPLLQNFEGVAVPTLPSGWSSGAGGPGPWTTTSNAPPNVILEGDPDELDAPLGLSGPVSISAFVPDSTNASDGSLYSPLILIRTDQAQLSFRHSFDLEPNFDGAVLEIAVGTQPFADVLQAGGSFALNAYNATLVAGSGPLGGRAAWSGNSGGWLITEVNLPPNAAQQFVQLRWRLGSNSSVGGNGWFIDDVGVSEYLCLPRLSTFLTSTNTAVVKWTSPATGWMLQQNTNLAVANWTDVTEAIHDNGTNKFIIVNPPTGNRFYRLFKP